MTRRSRRSAGDAGSSRAGRTHDRLTRGLGWASVGLGIPLLVAPGWSAEAIGVGGAPRQRTTALLVGAQELTAAAGLLGRGHPWWLWARATGDVLHLGLLGSTLRDLDRPGWERRLAATAGVAAALGLDLYAAVSRGRRTTMELTGTTTVTCSAREAYEIWRQLDRLPRFMTHLDEVRQAGDGLSHWRASAPFGRAVEWDARLTDDVPGERIAWRSVDGAIGTEGEARFRAAPGGRGSEVHVRLRYTMPGGPLGAAAARYFGEEPHQQIDDDLRRFKQVAETGEVVRSDGAPGGKRARREFPQHPARPLSEKELHELERNS